MECLKFLKKKAIESVEERNIAYAERCRKAFYEKFGCWVNFKVYGETSAMTEVEGLQIYAGDCLGKIMFHEYSSSWPRELRNICDLGEAFLSLERRQKEKLMRKNDTP